MPRRRMHYRGAQSRTVKGAVRMNRRWQPAEDAVLESPDLSTEMKAIKLGRSYAATAMRIQRLRKMKEEKNVREEEQ